MTSRGHFRSLEERFEKLLSLADETYAPDGIAAVREYMDHGEYGLALDTFAGVVVERNKAVGGPVAALIDELAARMRMVGGEFGNGLSRYRERYGDSSDYRS